VQSVLVAQVSVPSRLRRRALSGAIWAGRVAPTAREKGKAEE
jgi:hypothetical protein